MIISHRYKFIFLKTEKTASSSIFWALKTLVEAEDRLLPAMPALRRRLLREHGSLEGFSFIGSGRGVRRLLPGLTGLHRHARARDVRRFIGADLFERYTIITSERNPFDRQVSLYRHRMMKRGGANPADFSHSMVSPVYGLLHYNRLHNWDIYTINGKVIADHIIRFENLESDFRRVIETIGLDPDRHALPHRRVSNRSGDARYRDFYSDAARRRVATWYRREIEYFGYEF